MSDEAWKSLSPHLPRRRPGKPRAPTKAQTSTAEPEGPPPPPSGRGREGQAVYFIVRSPSAAAWEDHDCGLAFSAANRATSVLCQAWCSGDFSRATSALSQAHLSVTRARVISISDGEMASRGLRTRRKQPTVGSPGTELEFAL